MIKTGKEFANAACNVADNYKTLYVLGCCGAPLNYPNKKRYCDAQAYNRRADRKRAIDAATPDTFGFDCVGLIKGLLWGWSGKTNSVYGGASYCANGVPDLDANAMLRCCSGITTDFSNIAVGEVVWLPDHIGIYVGSGLVVECTHRWSDGVQFTALANVGGRYGYNTRHWDRHGKLPYISYEATDDKPQPSIPEERPLSYSLDSFIRDIQNIEGVRVDGLAGPVTLQHTVTISRTKNNRHKMVLPLQRRLYTLGYYDAGFDGCAGPGFERAVKAMQKDIGSSHPDGEFTAACTSWKYVLNIK